MYKENIIMVELDCKVDILGVNYWFKHTRTDGSKKYGISYSDAFSKIINKSILVSKPYRMLDWGIFSWGNPPLPYLVVRRKE